MNTPEKDDVVVSKEIANTHAQEAQVRVEELRKWREQIPRFAIPPANDAARRLSVAASVSTEFVELTNVAVANQASLVRVEALTPTQVRELVAYADAYDPIADELEAMAHFLRYSTTAARNEACTEALTTYDLTKRLSRQRKYAHLKPYVADMRRALGRQRKPTLEEAAKNAADRAARATAKLKAKTARMVLESETK